MRLLRSSSLLAALVALPILYSSTADAYDAAETHRWLTRQAVELLVASYPGEYDEAAEHIEDLVEGAFHEDDLYADGDQDPETLRVMRHFYHAQTKAGLTYGEGSFPNSYEWNGVENAQNEWDYHDGLLAYQHGNLGEAFFIAGHTMHLIEDLTVPAHSHLDQHGPPHGDDYEQHCKGRTQSATESSLKGVAEGTALPEFTSLADAFQRTADASFYRNFYPGSLAPEGEATGVIRQMFPKLELGWFTGRWNIPGVGKLDAAFFQEAPGYFYFKVNNVRAEVDVVNYDAASPEDRRYGPIAKDRPLVERMADDLTPIAILHAAAVLKLFVDQARELPVLAEPESELETQEPAPAGCNASAGANSLLSAFLLLLLVVAFRRQE